MHLRTKWVYRIEVIIGVLYAKLSAENFPFQGSASTFLQSFPTQITESHRGLCKSAMNDWRDVPLASVSDRILPMIYEYEFVPVTTKEQPTAIINGNFLVERPKFPCPRCLYYHSKFECGQSPRFNCPYCVYRTKHVSNVRAHVRRKHPGNKVYAIDVCKIGS